LPASRTIDAHRATPASTFAPDQRVTLRAACHGTTAVTPSSVAAWIAASSLPPFASAWTSTIRVDGSGSSRSDSTRSATRSFATSTASASATRPLPSPTATCSPTRRRETCAACRASSPVSSASDSVSVDAR
jgi:hypothetical protein